ncbi:MAG: Ig-like domain-containing protein [Acutalibacteraceae bacterium]|nr:Ig-like domain-containing protein [Acutalibacteraceae bacterium]
MKRLFSLFIVVCVLMTSLTAINAGAVTTTCTTYSGSNVNSQNYSQWSSTIKSYLTTCDNGNLMRVQYVNSSTGYIVEYYDTSYNLLRTKTISTELPIFGAFYETDSNYFILSGQTNTEESADVEVFRITKYDKNWNRIASTGLYDCNTTVPFDAGSARMDVCGDYLLIRTSHEMYTSADGYNHQANVTIQLNMNTMAITDSYTCVMNSSYGYVSHSFNQFIKVEDNKIIAVDHGDAYPRSVALLKYNTDVSTGTFTPTYYTKCDVVNLLNISGSIGANYTGVSVGGFEISDSAYLTVGNTINQNNFANTNNSTTRNIFVSVLPKSGSTATTNMITSYGESEGTVTTPQFVKIDNNNFILLWGKDDKVYYTKIDGNGNQIGSIYSMDGYLSDCVPVLVNGKLVWYTWKQGTNTFYEINVSNLLSTNKIVIENGHHFNCANAANGVATLTCSKCSTTQLVDIPVSFSVWWKEQEDTSSYYWSAYSNPFEVGESIGYWVKSIMNSDLVSNVSNTDYELIFSDETAFTVSKSSTSTGTITMNKPGEYTLTIRHIYDHSLSKSYSFVVNGKAESVTLDNTSLDLTVNETKKLNASLSPSDAEDTLTWTSSDTNVATIDDNGNVTAVGVGTTNITVAISNGATATCTVTVKSAPSNVTLSKTSLSLTEGRKYLLKPSVTPSDATTTYTWTSSDTSVATVNKYGNVTGVSTGTATITVKTSNGKTATCTVTVVKLPTSVELSKKAITVTEGRKYLLKSSVTPSDATTTYTWTSSDTSVATVNKYGNVTAIGTGTATITVKTSNGKTATCTVVVK